jgi:hypothetical protein
VAVKLDSPLREAKNGSRACCKIEVNWDDRLISGQAALAEACVQHYLPRPARSRPMKKVARHVERKRLPLESLARNNAMVLVAHCIGPASTVF